MFLAPYWFYLLRHSFGLSACIFFYFHQYFEAIASQAFVIYRTHYTYANGIHNDDNKNCQVVSLTRVVQDFNLDFVVIRNSTVN